MQIVTRLVERYEDINEEVYSGKIRYQIELDFRDFSVNELVKLVSRLKEDFPKLKRENVFVEKFSDYDLDIYFYYDEIPKEMSFDYLVDFVNK